MRFPWQREPVIETRQQGPYTDAVIAGILAANSLSPPAEPTAIGALETASAIWSRGFAAAQVTPVNWATRAITPSVLACIGREIIRRGEALFALKVVNGMMRLVPAGSWDVRGGWNEDEWLYRLDLFGASYHESELLPSTGVIHARYSIDPAQPFQGVNPLRWARLTASFAANVEARLGEEAGAPVGHLLPVPSPGAAEGDDDNLVDPMAQLRADLKGLKGTIALVETTAAGFGEGRSGAPQADWAGRRFGANPPAGVVETYGLSARAVLSACGVPVALASDADGTSQRESWRRFAMGSLEPTARMVAEELGRKLNTPDLAFDFSSLWARDLVARGQFLKAAVASGVSTDKALDIAGLADDE